ncbi:unnamed protein product [Musa textilis]
MFCYRRPLNFLQEFVGGGGGRFLEHFSSRATGGRGGGHFLELFASTRRRIGSILSSSAAAVWPPSVTPLDASPTTVLVSAGWRRVGYCCGDPAVGSGNLQSELSFLGSWESFWCGLWRRFRPSRRFREACLDEGGGAGFPHHGVLV